jgi:hypothetical protein
MKVYKIECEWDMGFKEIYKTKAEAEQAIQDTDWSDVLEDENDSVEKLMEEGYLLIKPINL